STSSQTVSTSSSSPASAPSSSSNRSAAQSSPSGHKPTHRTVVSASSSSTSNSPPSGSLSSSSNSLAHSLTTSSSSNSSGVPYSTPPSDSSSSSYSFRDGHFPCPCPGCSMLFSSKADVKSHVDRHVDGMFPGRPSSSALLPLGYHSCPHCHHFYKSVALHLPHCPKKHAQPPAPLDDDVVDLSLP